MPNEKLTPKQEEILNFIKSRDTCKRLSAFGKGNL